MAATQFDADLDVLGAHYTRLDSAVSILQSGKIRLSAAGQNLNDPAEIAVVHLTESPTIKWSGFDVPVHNVLTTRLRENARMFCLCMMHEGIASVAAHAMTAPSREHPFVSERRPHLIGRMWAQYTDNHKGIALCFDVSHLMRNIKNAFTEKNPDLTTGWGPYIWGAPIRYLSDADQKTTLAIKLDALPDSPAPTDSADAQQWEAWKNAMRQRHHQRLYFTKTDDWQGEQEFRCYWFDPPTMVNTTTIEIPIVGALKAIVVGERAPKLLDVAWREAAARFGATLRYGTVLEGVMKAYPSRLRS